jgi:DNA-binding SARP family transcriptional activator
MNTICPTCHQTIGTSRLGVRLTPLKALIVDHIKIAGDIGISSEELRGTLWEERKEVSINTVKAHIWQINSILEETDWIIHSDRRHWFLSRRASASLSQR